MNDAAAVSMECSSSQHGPVDQCLALHRLRALVLACFCEAGALGGIRARPTERHPRGATKGRAWSPGCRRCATVRRAGALCVGQRHAKDSAWREPCHRCRSVRDHAWLARDRQAVHLAIRTRAGGPGAVEQPSLLVGQPCHNAGLGAGVRGRLRGRYPGGLFPLRTLPLDLLLVGLAIAAAAQFTSWYPAYRRAAIQAPDQAK